MKSPFLIEHCQAKETLNVVGIELERDQLVIQDRCKTTSDITRSVKMFYEGTRSWALIRELGKVEGLEVVQIEILTFRSSHL